MGAHIAAYPEDRAILLAADRQVHRRESGLGDWHVHTPDGEWITAFEGLYTRD